MAFVKRYLWLILSLIIAVLAGRMLLTTHHFYVHDDMQVFRVNEYVKCFTDGQFPCRWSKDLGKGYGYPLFNYYPPMIYAVPAILHLLGFSIVTSLNLFAFGTFLLAAIGMYLLGRALTGKSVLGFFASALYILYPFHAVNVFIRGVQAENFVWSLTPLILYLIWQMIKHERWSRTLPLFFALIFLSHILSSFIIIGLSLIWVIIATYYHGKSLSGLWRTLAYMLLGLALSAFFFVPAMIEKNAVQSQTLISGYYSYFNHFVGLKQLFTEYKWNYGASYWGTPIEEMPYMVGHIHLAMLGLLSLYLIFRLLKQKQFLAKNSKIFSVIIALLLLASSFLFLTHVKSTFLWQSLLPLQYYQFPWRFIAWAGLPLTLSLAMLFSLLPKKLTVLTVLTAITVLTIYSYPFYFPRAYDTQTDQVIIDGEERQLQQVKSLYDYLPVSVHQVPEGYATSPLFTKYDGVLAGESFRNSRYFKVDLRAEEATVVMLSQFYFPGWVGTNNGKNIEIIPDDHYGLTQVYLYPGDNNIELKWVETPFRRGSDYLSFVAIALYFVYLLGYNKSHAKRVK